MMPVAIRKIALAAMGALLSLGLSLFPYGSVYAACTDATPCKPFFKAFGADVSAGGWFVQNSNCATGAGSMYQDPNYAPTGGSGDQHTGGILSYAKQDGSGNATGGSSSQYAAFALGLIEGDTTGGGTLYGFYSGGALSANGPTSKSYLSFANFTSMPVPAGAYWGGLLGGSSSQLSQCIPDYYSKRPIAGSPGTISGIPIGGFSGSSSGSSIYLDSAPAGSLNLVNGNFGISAGDHITVYVDGNVYIRNNITYPNSYRVDQVPKFALVVLGSIYIDPSVDRLDGLYIAQPDPSNPDPVNNDTGEIWTCHGATTNPVTPSFPNSCSAHLVVNGALIAKRVNLLRTGNSDVSTTAGTGSQDQLSGAISTGHVPEIFNYSPAMVVGGPFFTNSSSSNKAVIESLISLPPVF